MNRDRDTLFEVPPLRAPTPTSPALILASSLGLALAACMTPRADRSACRVAHPHTRVGSADPFEAAQPMSGRSIAPQDPRGRRAEAFWGCVHVTHETHGLLATGGSYPCLAAIGDARQGANPDADAAACPPWVEPYSVALYSDERTRALRSSGVNDACCYELRERVFHAASSDAPPEHRARP